MVKSKKKAAGSVNVDAVARDVKKMVEAYDPTPQKFTPPPSVKRESPLEQQLGTEKYRHMIHDHNEKNKSFHERLPFTFPKKKAIRSNQNLPLVCENCEEINWGTEFTVGVICVGCKKYSKVKNLDAEFLGYNPDTCVGFQGTASDLINKKD